MSEGPNPFEPPRAAWEKVETRSFSGDEFVDAGQGARFANFLIDMVVRTGMAVGAIGIFGEDAVFAPLLLLVGYYIIFEALFARTPAKWITRTRVIALDGSRPRLLQIVGRSFARYVPFEPFSFLGNARGWHDRWSSTRVVKDRLSTG
jgi:uncharacterized RDD family membrane protein YckC